MDAEQWNELVPVGTAVRYYPIWGEWDDYRDTNTRSAAFVTLACLDHTVMVLIEGVSGGVPAKHVRVDVERTIKAAVKRRFGLIRSLKTPLTDAGNAFIESSE